MLPGYAESLICFYAQLATARSIRHIPGFGIVTKIMPSEISEPGKLTS
jgi:hypothetical protein